ncbi:cytochrome c biogenesis factor [Bradyrhizobium sp. USDA 10063]
MIAEAGHYALVLALGLALIQSVVPMLGARWRDVALMNVARSTALAQLLFVGVSFTALVTLHVTSDFSVVNVFENSHSMKPLIYKITGVWGNHEGSMLLWVSILALFGGLVAAFGNNLPLTLRAHVLAVQAWIASAFYLFILLTSNPFLRIANPPIEGRDLNPVLQDIGLAVHPPMLYLGYVGFSISFSFAVAALIEGRIDAAWARWVRPWTLLAWIFLTLGIAMGSYWAYYELGWGGWWFWDPVENASLMPWLAGTALLHSALVMEKRNALKVWTILLSILTFSLSLLGTFLVRSGVLTSVHAFATDPARGVFILLILCVFIGGSLSLYAARASSLKQGGLFAPISREGALVLNNLFLTTACATVFIGTLYPLALEVVTGDKISVGAPFFNLTFGPLFVPLMIAVPFGPMLAWKRGDSAWRSPAPDRGRHRRAGRDRGAVGLDAWRRQLCAACDRACGIRRRRRAHRPRRAHRAVPASVRHVRAAGARPAACSLGHGLRPCRRRHRPDRDRLRDHVEQRIYRHHEAGRRRQSRGLRTEARRCRPAPGPEFPRDGGEVHRRPRRKYA